MLHIAILDIDVPVPAVYAVRGLYSSQFRTLLQSAASRLGLPASSIHTTAFDVVGGSLPPLQGLRSSPRESENGVSAETTNTNPLALPIDGILITGAAAAAYEAAKYPWIIPLQGFVQTVFESYPHVKLFGSCFGHQIIGQALLSAQAPNKSPPQRPSVTVERNPRGSEMGLASIKLTPKFRAAFPVLSTHLPAADEMRLQMIHSDWVALLPGVEELPEPWVNVGSTELCPVQGLYYRGRVLTYQGHFEFDVFVNSETCVEFGRRSGWENADMERYLALIGRGRVEGVAEDDGDAKVAAEVVVSFFLGQAENESLGCL
ncbi:class I glutamine amidotransferase-like protein [Aspergillus similis]